MFFKYEIKNGDSLNKIASRYHTTKEFIKDINNIYFEDKLRVGSEIIVPSNDVIYFDKYLINNGDTLYAIANKVNYNPNLYFIEYLNNTKIFKILFTFFIYCYRKILYC